MKHLLNTPDIRIRQAEQGFVVEVEIQQRTWYGRKYSVWTHVISYHGLRNKPYYYSTYAMALNEFLSLIKFDITYKSHNY